MRCCCFGCEYARECEGDCNAGVGDEGCVIAVSARCEYMDGTRGSGIVSGVYDLT